jgi:hypothetical protein
MAEYISDRMELQADSFYDPGATDADRRLVT